MHSLSAYLCRRPTLLQKLASLANLTPAERKARLEAVKARKAAGGTRGSGLRGVKPAPGTRTMEALQSGVAQETSAAGKTPGAAAPAAKPPAAPAAKPPAAPAAKPPAAAAATTAATEAAEAAPAVTKNAPKNAPKVPVKSRLLTGRNAAILGGAAALGAGGMYLYNRHRKQASIAEYSVLFDKVASGGFGTENREALYGICQSIEAPVITEKVASIESVSSISESDARKARLDQLLKR